MESKSGCLVCGSELKYLQEYVEKECFYCKNKVQSNVSCSKDHFICDRCHSLSALDLIEEYCLTTTSINPVEIANVLMHSDAIKMHGPEHHYLVPAVLLAAYCNLQNDATKKEKLAIAKQRAEKVPGGFCGTHGNCGAAVGTGIFISIITKATSLSGNEWQLSNMMTATSLMAIAKHGGPRCCKRDTFLAITETVDYLKNLFEIEMPFNEIKCDFSEYNKQCLHEKCTFYKLN